MTAAHAPRDLTHTDVAAIVDSVLTKRESTPGTGDMTIFHELEALARYIAQARADIAAVQPSEILNTHIPSATDELDAVVGATEEATGQILDACEGIEATVATMPAATADAVTGAVTRIYEACNFQDITGQRITKVVRTLKHIETQVNTMLAALGDHEGRPAPVVRDAVAGAELLNGPQLPGNGIDQSEIDRLFD